MWLTHGLTASACFLETGAPIETRPGVALVDENENGVEAGAQAEAVSATHDVTHANMQNDRMGSIVKSSHMLCN